VFKTIPPLLLITARITQIRVKGECRAIGVDAETSNAAGKLWRATPGTLLRNPNCAPMRA
jgi:hypothetical protein